LVPAAAAASATVKTTLTRVANRRAFSTSASQDRIAHARWISADVGTRTPSAVLAIDRDE
jgi:hypothetical protein